MRFRRSHFRGWNTAAQPCWRRWVAVLCLLVVTLVATAQAVHAHGGWALGHHVAAQQPGPAVPIAADDGHCPLCVAMHSAQPVATHRTSGADTHFAHRLAESTLRAHETRWHFARFSRPPPLA